MKFKKIFIIICTVSLIVLIYRSTSRRTLNYLNIGDDKFYSDSTQIKRQLVDSQMLNTYNSSFTKANSHIIDLINTINANEKDGNKTIRNLLIKADIVTLSIGKNDLDRSRLTYEYIDEVMLDMDSLFKLLRENCKEKIYILNFLDSDKYYIYANKRLKELCSKYEIDYIDQNKDDYLNPIYDYISKNS